MNEKIKLHFERYRPQTFVVVAVLVLLITDLLNSVYLKLYWLNKNLSYKIVEVTLSRTGQHPSDFDQTTLSELIGLCDNAFYFFIVLILVNNLFFYFFYLRKKLWAQGYVLFYTLTAGLMSLSFIFDNGSLGYGWILYNTLTIPVYLYLFLGVKVLKDVTTVPSPVRGKKGR